MSFVGNCLFLRVVLVCKDLTNKDSDGDQIFTEQFRKSQLSQFPAETYETYLLAFFGSNVQFSDLNFWQS